VEIGGRMEKVSIIVPVYNAQKYLDKCIKSIINQTYRNCEIILINDGSTDNSLNICMEYEKKHSNIMIINQENGGPSIARNNGIKNASGKYLVFVDSDDEIQNNMIEKMVANLEKNQVDLVVAGVKKIFYKNSQIAQIKEIKYQKTLLNDFDEIVNYFWPIFDKNGFNALWNKIYKLDIIKKNNIRLDNSLNMGEDYLFNLNYIVNAKKVLISDEILYNYKIEYNILTNKFEEDLFEHRMIIWNKTQETLKNNNCLKDANDMKYLYVKFIYAQIIMLSHPNCTYTKEKKKEIIDNMYNEMTKEILHKIKIKFNRYSFLAQVLKLKNKGLLLFIGEVFRKIKK